MQPLTKAVPSSEQRGTRSQAADALGSWKEALPAPEFQPWVLDGEPRGAMRRCQAPCRPPRFRGERTGVLSRFRGF